MMVFQADQASDSATDVRRMTLQRKCACGRSMGLTGECVECRRKRLNIQAKLYVNQHGDPYEKEAERVAGQLMRMPGPSPYTEQDDGLGQNRPRVEQRVNGIEKETQTEVPLLVHDVLNSTGRPLDANTRQFMESRLGHDFSHIRVHSDERSACSARMLGAIAYTVGSDLVFGSNAFAPNTGSGRRLLAHELAHVVQQNAAAPIGENTGSMHSANPKRIIQRFRGPIPTEEELGLRLAEKTAEAISKSSVRKAGWAQFWRAVARRFAVRGTAAVAMAAADGPMIIGDLLVIGMTLYTIYEIIELWDELWQEAELIPELEEQPIADPDLAEEIREDQEGLEDVDLDEDVDEDEACPFPTGLTRDDPIPMVWLKNPYDTNLFPSPITLDGENYHIDDADGHLPRGEELGVDSTRYFPWPGKLIRLIPEPRGDKTAIFRNNLESYGFDWGGRRTLNADHVQDIFWGSATGDDNLDVFRNLWPFDGAANSSAGSRQNVWQQVTFCENRDGPMRVERMKDMRKNYIGRWFVISAIDPNLQTSAKNK